MFADSNLFNDSPEEGNKYSSKLEGSKYSNPSRFQVEKGGDAERVQAKAELEQAPSLIKLSATNYSQQPAAPGMSVNDLLYGSPTKPPGSGGLEDPVYVRSQDQSAGANFGNIVEGQNRKSAAYNRMMKTKEQYIKKQEMKREQTGLINDNLGVAIRAERKSDRIGMSSGPTDSRHPVEDSTNYKELYNNLDNVYLHDGPAPLQQQQAILGNKADKYDLPRDQENLEEEFKRQPIRQEEEEEEQRRSGMHYVQAPIQEEYSESPEKVPEMPPMDPQKMQYMPVQHFEEHKTTVLGVGEEPGNQVLQGTNHGEDMDGVYDPGRIFIDEITSKDTPLDKKRQLMMSPLPKAVGTLQCTITRHKTGFSRFYPKYELVISGSYQFLLYGKKRSIQKTSNYLLTMDQKNLKKSGKGFLGKVRSNFLGTEFNIYDHGANPNKKKLPDEKIRIIHGSILYESNLLGSRGPRKMQCLFPKIFEDGSRELWRPRNKKDHMIPKFKAGEKDRIDYLINKPPKWNDALQAFVLNFNGRVIQPSVKNFQLVDTYDENTIFMQFGRVAKHIFNIDFQYPLSIFQAFAVALSSFDFKIACE